MNKKRYLYLAIGTIAMTVYGLMYCWTVFSPFVQTYLQVHVSKVSNIFSFCQIGFCLGGLFGGFTYYKLNYKISMVIASCMMFLGLYIASRANSIMVIIIGFSVMYNFMAGFAYKTVLTAVLSWFKDKPGLASGVIVMGAGLTAFMFNTPLSKMIQQTDWQSTMITLACITGILSILSALFIKPQDKVVNKKSTTSETEQVTTQEMMKDSRFYVYFCWSVLLLAGCSSISGTAVNCGLSFGMNHTTAAKLTMIISLSNSLSRIFYGLAYDKFGRNTAMLIATGSFSIAVFLLGIAFVSTSYLLLGIAFLFFGISFGGIPTISSAYILTTFGSEYYPSNFSIHGLYSLFSPFLGTMVYSKLLVITTGGMLAYGYLPIYAVITFVLLMVLNKIIEKRKNRKLSVRTQLAH